MSYRDEIIAEVWRNRDTYAAQHHNNLNEMVADLRERQKRPGCRLVDRRNMGLKRNVNLAETQRPQA